MKKVIMTLLSIAVAVNLSIAEAKPDNEKQLPPGLQKKLARGGELPPGWEKKLRPGEPLDNDVYSAANIVAPLDQHGVITVEIEGRIIRLIEASREIIAILK